MDFEYKNLVYISFVEIKDLNTVVSYPDPAPDHFTKIIDEARIKLFSSFSGPDIGASDILVKGVSVFFVCDEDKDTGAYLITLGDNYPRRFANSLLIEFVNLVISNGYKRGDSADDIQRQIRPELFEIFRRYDSVVGSDAATLVKLKTISAIDNIGESIANVYESVINVKILKDNTDKLKDKSENMFKSAQKMRRYYNKPVLMFLGIGSACAVVTVTIVCLSVFLYQKK